MFEIKKEFDWEAYKNKAELIAQNNAKSMKKTIEERKNIPNKDKIAEFKAHIIKENDYETIDRRIYAIEHRFVYDGVIDWNGSKINEDWEAYKERVGYYKRHPEEEEYSRAFTKKFIEAQVMLNESERLNSQP